MKLVILLFSLVAGTGLAQSAMVIKQRAAIEKDAATQAVSSQTNAKTSLDSRIAVDRRQ